MLSIFLLLQKHPLFQYFVLNQFLFGDHLVGGAEFELAPGLIVAGNIGVAMTGGPVTDFLFGARVAYAF